MRHGAHEACLRDSKMGRCAFMPVRRAQTGASRQAPVANGQTSAVQREDETKRLWSSMLKLWGRSGTGGSLRSAFASMRCGLDRKV